MWLRATLLVVLLVGVGCVGTIEDTKLSKTKTATTKTVKLPFSGLASAEPIAHDKVEVYFYPAKGKPEDLTYEIYVNGSEAPIFIAGNSMTPNPSGKLMYTVTGLQVNTTYSFAVSATNNETKSSSDSGDTLSATTFANITADFAGIASVRTPAGVAGQSSVIVEWVGATTTGSAFNPKTADPVGYEVTFISDTGGANNLNNASYTGNDRVVNLVPNPIPESPLLATERSRTITGLASGKKYFFQVRAYHKGYIMFGGLNGDSNYKREQNHKFLSIVTGLPTGMFNFETSLVKAINPDGKAALTNIDVTWKPATGDFDHYRVYFKEMGKEKVLGDPVEDPATVLPVDEVDYFSEAGGQIDRLNGLNKYDRVDADASYFRLTNLPSYRHFQIKVVACGNAVCDVANRQVSDPVTKTTTFPKVAPFDGIDHIDHPRAETTTRRIHAVFNSPVIASGYLDDLGLYCYATPTDASPKKLVYAKTQVGAGAATAGASSLAIDDGDYDAFPTSGAVVIGAVGDADYEVFSYTSKATVPSRLVSTNDTLDFSHLAGVEVNFSIKSADNCNGVYRSTPSPTTQEAFEIFEEVNIDGIEPSVGKEYCFSLVPKVDGDNTHYSVGPPNYNFQDIENMGSALIKCITPEIKTPTLAQFPGKVPTCSVAGRTINMTWSLPTGGMYNNFQAFWKRNNTGTPFQFAEAKTMSLPAPGGPIYWTKEAIDKTLTAYTVDPTTVGKPPLIPGERYFTGVLAYLQVGLDRYYSEANLNTGDCLIALPTVEFQEWTEVFAVGPKVDGLTPPDPITGARTMILETLDDSSVPVEVVLEGSGTGSGIMINEDPADGFYLSRGGTPFNGVYGTKDGDVANPKYQYSNTGMVRLSWKDVKFYSTPNLYMDDMISSYEAPDAGQNANFPFAFPATKGARVFGYKVYRSDNNKVTWTELTHKDFAYQKVSNGGLIRAQSRLTMKRNNVSADTDKIVTFTDYSVKYTDNNGEIERARIYWYKIVPVFNNTPLPLTDSSNIIKVTLPPPNMALVHRMMANRTICREMDRPINTTPGRYYSCDFNGVGASSTSFPWPVYTGLPGDAKPIYDLGGDLLVDRFELGCNFTRGDPRATPIAESDYPGDYGNGLANFQGRTVAWMGSTTGRPFQGCVGTDDFEYEPMNGHTGSGSSNTDTSYQRVHQGDCFGTAATTMTGQECADYTVVQPATYGFPGAINVIPNDASENCQTADYVYGTFYGRVGAPDYPNYWGEMWEGAGGNSWDGYPFQKHLVQSEPAAVYYRRNKGGYPQNKYPSSAGPGSYITDWGGNSISSGQCFINLPFVNTPANHPNVNRQDGDWTARWFAMNMLFNDKLTAPAPTGAVTLYNKTVNEVLNMPGFYATNDTKPTVWPTTTRFNPATTPIGKILSSNNAKLPPLGYLSQKAAYDLCGLYKVELGAFDQAAGSGSGVFYQIDAPASKRIMTKKEFNVVAAWPDIDSSATAGFADVNIYDETMITTIETGNYDHVQPKLLASTLTKGNVSGCNTQARLANNLGQDIWWNLKFSPRFPSTWGETDPYYWSGSSANDASGVNANSSRCVSKFGVQDLVGNMMEVVAEQVFCDFSGELMYLGPVADDQPSSIRMAVGGLGSGTVTPAVPPLPSAGTEVHQGGDRTVSWWGSNLDAYKTGPGGLVAWVQSQQNTGQCSTVQMGGERDQGTGMNFRSGTNMASIFDFNTWSGYNDQVIEWHGDVGPALGESGTGTGWGAHRTFGQELVLDDRGGDGYFLDWGQANVGPPIAYSEVFQIKALGSSSMGAFFNPAIGMTTACMEGPGYPAPCVDSPDNKDFTTTILAAAHGSGPTFGNPTIQNFPTNNGNIHNDGLRDLNFSAWHVSPNAWKTPFRYIDSVVAGGPLPDDDIWNIKYANGSTDVVSTSWAWWVISRSNPMYFNVGGDVTTSDAGRYYAYMRGDSPYNQENHWGRGSRCVIKINTAD
ncbi:MAG: hypothetical protein A2X86_03525 [Bdellovibrionales bacterium GWA2_49_15]|nr:MAG: hypothetical protein A2X86_03525 [Bdellovibrionales bacterium GWA2_49_15]HAZ12286.1 hypothetical protein [Bdellovibrionales bacterium]